MTHQSLRVGVRGDWSFQTRRAQAKQRTYEQLLTSARGLFEERGYEATTVRDVAQSVGMSTGAVFANFTDKAALFIDVINADCEKLNLRLAQLDLSGCSTLQALERMVAVAQDHHAEHLGLVQAAISFAWRSDISPERRSLHGLKLIRSRLAAVLHRGVECGELVFSIDVSLISGMLIDNYLASYRRLVFEDLRAADLRALQIEQVKALVAGYASRPVG